MGHCNDDDTNTSRPHSVGAVVHVSRMLLPYDIFTREQVLNFSSQV